MAPPWSPGARALRIYCCAGVSFLDLLLVVCCGRVLASRWMTVELLHTRIVARDGRPRGSTLPGGASFRRSPPFRHLPSLCFSSFLRTRPSLGDGSPLLRRWDARQNSQVIEGDPFSRRTRSPLGKRHQPSALRRSPSFWGRSFFPGGSRLDSSSLTLRHWHLLQGPRTLSRHASRQDRIAIRMRCRRAAGQAR